MGFRPIKTSVCFKPGEQAFPSLLLLGSAIAETEDLSEMDRQ